VAGQSTGQRLASAVPSGPGEENRMAFLFRLETVDGVPALASLRPRLCAARNIRDFRRG